MAHVEQILVRPDAAGPTEVVERVTAVAGQGIEGDRYFRGLGTFFVPGKSGQDLTLIEAEALEALEAEYGITLSGQDSGRNVVTRGVDLNALVGRSFTIGGVRCVGDRLCDPCATLRRRTAPGVLRGLAGRGGLRADIVEGGELVVGAALIAAEAA